MARNADVRQRFAAALFDIGVIQFGAFRLKLHETQPDAPLSPIYVDLRKLRSYHRVRTDAVDILADMASKIMFDTIADVPTAATPLVAILAHVLSCSMITPREPKTHGTGGTIDGSYHREHRVLLIDDLITSAGSKVTAIQTLRKAGLIVEHVAVLIDREQGGAAELHEHGCELHAAFRLRELLDGYLAAEKIDRTKHDEVVAYLKANARR